LRGDLAEALGEEAPDADADYWVREIAAVEDVVDPFAAQEVVSDLLAFHLIVYNIRLDVTLCYVPMLMMKVDPCCRIRLPVFLQALSTTVSTIYSQPQMKSSMMRFL
jgi:hypothetical protein